jgi:hypothetical protein
MPIFSSVWVGLDLNLLNLWRLRMYGVKLTLNGKEVDLSPEPILKDGIVLVPLESFSQQVGAEVKRLKDEGKMTICKGDVCVPLRVGDEVGGVTFINGAAYCPLSAFMALTEGAPKASAKMDRGTNDLAYDFILPDITTGQMVSLKDFRGVKTLVFCWASW